MARVVISLVFTLSALLVLVGCSSLSVVNQRNGTLCEPNTLT